MDFTSASGSIRPESIFPASVVVPRHNRSVTVKTWFKWPPGGGAGNKGNGNNRTDNQGDGETGKFKGLVLAPIKKKLGLALASIKKIVYESTSSFLAVISIAKLVLGHAEFKWQALADIEELQQTVKLDGEKFELKLKQFFDEVNLDEEARTLFRLELEKVFDFKIDLDVLDELKSSSGNQ